MRAQAPKRVGLQFAERSPRDVGPPQAGRRLLTLGPGGAAAGQLPQPGLRDLVLAQPLAAASRAVLARAQLAGPAEARDRLDFLPRRWLPAKW